MMDEKMKAAFDAWMQSAGVVPEAYRCGAFRGVEWSIGYLRSQHSSAASDGYDMIDRFLRNNLDDEDYAEYSAALDACYARPIPSAPAAPEGWKHDCAALLANDVELWVQSCPHCGKPRQTAPSPTKENSHD